MYYHAPPAGVMGLIRMNGEVPEGLVLDSTAPGGLSPYPPTPWQGLGKGQGEGRKGRHGLRSLYT